MQFFSNADSCAHGVTLNMQRFRIGFNTIGGIGEIAFDLQVQQRQGRAREGPWKYDSEGDDDGVIDSKMEVCEGANVEEEEGLGISEEGERETEGQSTSGGRGAVDAGGGLGKNCRERGGSGGRLVRTQG